MPYPHSSRRSMKSSRLNLATWTHSPQGLAGGGGGGGGLQVRQAPLEDVFLAVTLQAELEHAQARQCCLQDALREAIPLHLSISFCWTVFVLAPGTSVYQHS